MRGRSKIIGTASATAFILLALSALTFQLVPTASGQDAGLRIKNLNVSVWPEYDDPRVLVIYRGQFARGPTFPAWADFYIPDDAEINGAGIATPDGQLLLQEYKVYRAGDRNVISINLSIPSFFLEYYYNPFSGGAQKVFEQKIENRYPVDSMKVEVQRPLKAEDFTLTPKPDSSYTDSRGFSYFQYSFDNLTAESSVILMVSYKKEDPHPSVIKKMQVQPNDRETAAAEGRGVRPVVKAGRSWRIIAGVVFLAAAAVVAAAFVMKRTVRKREEAAEGPEKPVITERGWNFCPHCGAQLKADYRFCPGCGNRISREDFLRET